MTIEKCRPTTILKIDIVTPEEYNTIYSALKLLSECSLADENKKRIAIKIKGMFDELETHSYHMTSCLLK